MKNAANLFGILWLIIGLGHFGIALLIEASNRLPVDILAYYAFFLLPLRFLLIETVLDLRLDGWLKWTVIGTLVGVVFAALYIGIGFVILFSCCYGQSSPSDSIVPALIVLGFYPLFRLVLLAFQKNVPKLKKSSWILGNLPGILFVWFAFAYLFTYSDEPALGVFLTIVALTISELLTVNRLITVKTHQLFPDKRKVEDL